MRRRFRFHFQFRAGAFVATVLLVALGLALGNWQLRRAAGKIAGQASLAQRAAEPPLRLDGSLTIAAADPAALAYRRVLATGQFVADWPLFLDNRPLNGRQGLYLLMPFKLAGSGAYVLVARGWLPRRPEHDRAPDYATPAGVVSIEGVVKTGMGHVLQFDGAAPPTPGAMVQNIAPAQFAAASKLALLPFFIEQTGPAQAGEALVRDWPAPSLGVEKHQGYAFQWYALSLMALLFFVLTGFRRGTKQSD